MIHSLISKIFAILFPTSCYGCNKEGQTLCEACLHKTKKPLDVPHPYIISVHSFKDPLIKKVIHGIKYFHRKDLIRPLAQELAHKLVADHTLGKAQWVLIPIPMPRIRKYIRGYNQAELIAKELGKICGIPLHTTLLIRSKSPKRQAVTKTRSERLKNQHNTFTTTDKVSDLSIILVDDVTTTGATLEEARKVLLQSGAKSVKAVTLAH